jgi:AAA+ ATPase superfamily predicted ATPase
VSNTFFNRERELTILDERYHSSQAEFIVVTGRRRVGKTALLAQFAQDKPGVIFLAYLNSEEALLRQFSLLVRQAEEPTLPPDPDFTYGSWLGIFRAIGRLAADRRFLVIIDEYPYLVGGSRQVASQLQKVWDETLQHTRICLVICGSYISIMNRDLLALDAPLYGRRTGQLFLQPLTVQQAARFLPHYSPIEVVEAYALAGGTPAYLLQLSDQRSIWDNMRASVLRPGTMLYHEPDLLLREELREPRLYAAILRAIAAGHHQLSAIAQAAGIEPASTASGYLDLLKLLRWLEHHTPLEPTRARRGWGTWHLLDPYIRFWARYVLPHIHRLEYGEVEDVLYQIIRPTWSQFVGPIWEAIARQHLPYLSRERELPFWPEEIGSWWSAQVQIDLVGVNYAERLAVLGEARWRDVPMGYRDLEALQTRSRAWLGVQPGWELFYALYSKSGFSDELQALAQADRHVILKTPAQVIGTVS